jgi:hypothetical protein
MSNGATQTVTVYLTRAEEVILVRQRAEGELVGNLVEVLRPGGTFLDRPFEFWVGLGPGQHTVPIDDQEAPHA